MMKQLSRVLCFAGLAYGAFAQGTVNFGNGTATLISHWGGPSGTEVLPGVPGNYYFGLFTAPFGATDPWLFTFTGNYATNLAAPGRLLGGTSAVVNGWAPGETRAVLVYGWSADLGHDWNPSWLTGVFPGATPASQFGRSIIGPRVIPGGFDGTATLPTPVIFSSTGITQGFMLGVPEPASAALAGLAAALVLIVRWRN